MCETKTFQTSKIQGETREKHRDLEVLCIDLIIMHNHDFLTPQTYSSKKKYVPTCSTIGRGYSLFEAPFGIWPLAYWTPPSILSLLATRPFLEGCTILRARLSLIVLSLKSVLMMAIFRNEYI